MTALRPSDFAAFMREVSGFEPFPWQQRLFTTVLDGGWPPLLDLPTGTGKTSTLLISLFALAIAPEQSPRRIALVVDRRIIVDQVDGFARRIRAALADRANPVSTEVAQRLRSLSSSPDASPVRVVQLRGGIPRDDSWVGSPDQPTIISSTVDQIGSRLLFRGYGVSPSMRPIHAGILARDTLLFLDEVHLAAAFEETLVRLRESFEGWAEHSTGRALQVVRMSATPRVGEADSETFGLDEDDRAHPVLARRLAASRVATLEEVKTKRASDSEGRAENRKIIATAASKRVHGALGDGAAGVGLVVNRVDTARRAASLLREGLGDSVEVLLLTGRMRPFDKTVIQARLDATVAAGVERSEGSLPTVVVATSCIEAGADLDFDALVTEVASLDALRQRFGRLNRLGKHPSADAWILGSKDQTGANAADDPVYGAALAETWAYLHEVTSDDRVDFGLLAFPEPGADRRSVLLPPAPEAPLLFPSYLDMWSETRPAPHPDPDPALWLHGKGAKQAPDVNVLFRADVADLAGLDEATAEAQLGASAEAVEFLPPVADEAVSVDRYELRNFLEQQGADWAWRWSPEGLQLAERDDIRIGDTIVLAARLGGLGAGTWDPSSREPVVDVAELAGFQTRRIAKLRLHPDTLPTSLAVGTPRPTALDDPDELDAQHRACAEWLDRLADRADELPLPWRALVAALSDPKARRVIHLSTSVTGEALWRVTAIPPKRAVEATTEDLVSVFTGIEVTLADHLDEVRAWAHHFAEAAGLEAELAQDVALAGLLHDLGKADVRFQALLQGGDPIRAAGMPMLAKSRQFGSAKLRDRAQARSGWPLGLRHELVSLALFDASPELQARAHDVELVRHLIASHHGWCRPWAPNTTDPSPMQVRVEVAGITAEVSTAALDDTLLVECASRFRRLCRRYGWHGLAYLEALLRLGDHRASAQPGTTPGATS